MIQRDAFFLFSTYSYGLNSLFHFYGYLSWDSVSHCSTEDIKVYTEVCDSVYWTDALDIRCRHMLYYIGYNTFATSCSVLCL